MSCSDLVHNYEAQQLAPMSNKIRTAEELAAYRSNPEVPHYKDLETLHRFQWLGQEVVKINQILHRETVEEFLNMDVATLDENIMDDYRLADLTLMEIDEAFSRGICGAYGQYYGINALSLLDFLRSYKDTDKSREATKILAERAKQRRRQELDEQIRKEVEERRNA